MISSIKYKAIYSVTIVNHIYVDNTLNYNIKTK